MKRLFKNTSWTSAGVLLALICGSPAVADDTELLLVSPNLAVTPKPNILFIIDSSGSMDTLEETREIYDYTQPYAGGAEPCDANYLYWSELKSIPPSCSDSNVKRFLKTSFLCAEAKRRIEGIGSYRDTFVQFRDGTSGSPGGLDATRWQQLEPGNAGDIVECKTDRTQHGDGVDTSAVYAQKGGNITEPFTDDQSLEVSWTSWPTNQSITVYDGNYLNYRENPTLVDRQRIDIVKDVSKAVLNSISDVNVGIMRFNDNEGGPVILDIQDLDTNRTAIVNAINGIGADGATPVSEAFYEAALFWRGMPANYGESINEHDTDPAALSSTDPAAEVYEAPQTPVCAKNFNVVLTDGRPNNNEDTITLVNNLPDWFATNGYTGCTFTNDGDCLDDIANYLHNVDISTDTGEQNVTTHTIGFAIDLEILENTATRGGGDYFLADDVESLTIALLEIVNDITDRSLSFAAPAVAVNTFNRTQNLNNLYMTTFAAREKYHWPGNLKKYGIADGVIVDKYGDPAVDPATGLFYGTATSDWSSDGDGSDVEQGGALENLPGPAERKLYTNNTSNNLIDATNALVASNAGSFSLADFGLTGADGEPTKDELIRWALGEDVQDEDTNPATTVRTKTMGDPLHSQPTAVVYGGTADNPDLVVYMATNDGYLHAIDGSDGSELWAFIPKEHLPNLPSAYINADSPFKNYGIDGDVVSITADRDQDGVIEPGDDDFVYLIFGMRRGGNAYYALDVTNRNSPKVLWRTSAPEFGQTWSKPTVARVDINDPGLNDDKAVVVVGGGYDNAHDTLPNPATADAQGAGVFFLDLESGAVLWRAGADSDANLELPGTTEPGLTRSIPSQVRVIDLNGDSLADRMYAADMGGQILRFDITNGNQPDDLVTGGVIAQLGAEGNSPASFVDTRRFYNTPDVSLFNDNVQNRRFIAISIGSGYRAHPLDDTNADRFYSIRDRAVFNSLTQDQYNDFTPITEADLVEVSGQVGTTIGPDDAGWMLTLPDNQKVLSTSATFNNEIFFVAFSAATEEAQSCEAGLGKNFLYRIAVANGDPIADLDGELPENVDDLRVETLSQGGIAPSPTFLFPSPDADCTGDECAPPPIGCVGVECFDPGFQNLPVRTLWTQDGIE